MRKCRLPAAQTEVEMCFFLWGRSSVFSWKKKQVVFVRHFLIFCFWKIKWFQHKCLCWCHTVNHIWLLEEAMRNVGRITVSYFRWLSSGKSGEVKFKDFLQDNWAHPGRFRTTPLTCTCFMLKEQELQKCSPWPSANLFIFISSACLWPDPCLVIVCLEQETTHSQMLSHLQKSSVFSFSFFIFLDSIRMSNQPNNSVIWPDSRWVSRQSVDLLTHHGNDKENKWAFDSSFFFVRILDQNKMMP